MEEKNRSWCSGGEKTANGMTGRDNDFRAVTIEVANDGGSPDWHVSDKALAATIDLCADICQRNGIEKLNFAGDASGNLTLHNFFAYTLCPGPYLESKFQYIAEEVNERLGENPTSEPAEKITDQTASVKDTASLPMLRKGSRGASVKALQILLIGNQCSCGSCGADGDFGGGTEFAVKTYQEKHDLDYDGVVGPMTWTKLLGLG